MIDKTTFWVIASTYDVIMLSLQVYMYACEVGMSFKEILNLR